MCKEKLLTRIGNPVIPPHLDNAGHYCRLSGKRSYAKEDTMPASNEPDDGTKIVDAGTEVVQKVKPRSERVVNVTNGAALRQWALEQAHQHYTGTLEEILDIAKWLERHVLGEDQPEKPDAS